MCVGGVLNAREREGKEDGKLKEEGREREGGKWEKERWRKGERKRREMKVRGII